MESHPFAFSSRQEKKSYVRKMFSEIARTYDLLNHLLSLGFDFYWRKRAIARLRHHLGSTSAARILDIACGTGDLSLEAMKQIPHAKIVAVDLAPPMLDRFRKKLAKRQLKAEVEEGDVEALRFDDATFDAVTIGFGTRNFTALDVAFKEILRVLKPGGIFINLELAKPRTFPLKQFYRLYFERMLPFFARRVSQHNSADTYQPDSLRRFPDLEPLATLLAEAGFSEPSFETLTGGIVAIHTGVKGR